MSTGKRLQDYRKNNNISVEDMSKKLDVKERTYGSYERNEANIPTPILIKLHDLCDIDLNWLLTGKETQTKSSNKKEVLGDAKLLDMIFDCLEDMTDQSKEKIYYYCKIEKLNQK